MIVSKESILHIFKKMDVNITLIPNAINEWVNAFNSLGIEVENIISNHLNKDDYSIVKIIELTDHPNSDHLHICKVFDGNKEHQIICGASNVYENMYTIMAKINTVMPAGFKIEPRKLRGIESYGMLCSLSELFPELKPYLSHEDDNGIIDLKKQGNKKINFNIEDFNANWIEYLMLNDDIFDLSISTNVGYLNGLVPIAISLLAFWNINYKLDSNLIINHNIDNFDNLNDFGLIKFNNYDNNDYYLRMILARNFLKAKNHPERKALLYSHYFAYSFFAISNSVDINLVTLTKIDKESTISFENKEYIIPKNTDVLIYDNKILGLPGILISDNFKVSDKDLSFNLLYMDIKWWNALELVNRLNINSFQSKLSTKNISFYFANHYLKYFFPYILQNDIIVLNHFDENSKVIKFSIDSLFTKLTNFLIKDKNKILNQLKLFQINYDDSKQCFLIPSYRKDLLQDQDLIEEILKFLNVNTLEPEPIFSSIISNQDTKEYDEINIIRNYFINLGFYETKTYNLTTKNDFNKINLDFYNHEFQFLINPISSEREVLKNTNFFSLYKVIQNNLNKKNFLLHNIFEINKLYWKNNNETNWILSALVINDIAVQQKFESVTLSLSVIFNLIQNIFYKFNSKNLDINFKEIKDINNFSSIYLIYFENNIIGYIGVLKEKFEKNFVNNSAYYFELNLDGIFTDTKDQIIFNKYSDLHSISRDININLNETINYDLYILNLKKDISNVFSFIKEINIKSIYNSDNMNVITLNFVLKQDRQLSKDEIEKHFDQIIKYMDKWRN